MTKLKSEIAVSMLHATGKWEISEHWQWAHPFNTLWGVPTLLPWIWSTLLLYSHSGPLKNDFLSDKVAWLWPHLAFVHSDLRSNWGRLLRQPCFNSSYNPATVWKESLALSGNYAFSSFRWSLLDSLHTKVVSCKNLLW